jgi:hypothetical protein
VAAAIGADAASASHETANSYLTVTVIVAIT